MAIYRRLQSASQGLMCSFGAVLTGLESPRVAWRAVAVLLVIHTGLLGYSAYVHSPTKNEPGHLVAGLSHWEFGRFDLYRVNPPLVRSVAAIPVLLAGYKEDWSSFYEGPGARPEYYMGDDFVKANGERSYFLVTIARWACIPFSWIGALICYRWAGDLYGRPSGVLASGIWCFEPNILAHASLMTADCHATAIGLAACYAFWRWLRVRTWSNIILAGGILGLAELSKLTLLVLYPLWPLIWLIYRWPDRRIITIKQWAKESAMIAIALLIGTYVINLGHGFTGIFEPLERHQFVSKLLTAHDTHSVHDIPLQAPEDVTPRSNRFTDTILGHIPMPLPRNYILGFDAQQRDFEDRGRHSYLRGTWHNHGWWYYYLYAAAVKTPLGLQLIICIATYSLLWERLNGNSRCRTRLRDEGVLIIPAMAILIVVSSQTGFSEHFRYCLPALPFLFVIAGRTICGKAMGATHPASSLRATKEASSHMAVSVALLATWMTVSSLYIYPHSISYFNESVGGPLNGPLHLLGSNVDWGQDFLYAMHEQRKSGNCGSVRYWTVAPTPAPDCEPPVATPNRTHSDIVSVNIAFGSPERLRSNSHEDPPNVTVTVGDDNVTSSVVGRYGYSLLLVPTRALQRN